MPLDGSHRHLKRRFSISSGRAAARDPESVPPESNVGESRALKCRAALRVPVKELLENEQRELIAMEQPREDEREGGFEAGSEYVTVPQLAKKLHLSPKTIYNWIRFGDIGEADGIFDVHGRMLIHWPTFRKRQFKPLRRPNGAL